MGNWKITIFKTASYSPGEDAIGVGVNSSVLKVGDKIYLNIDNN